MLKAFLNEKKAKDNSVKMKTKIFLGKLLQSSISLLSNETMVAELQKNNENLTTSPTHQQYSSAFITETG